jgi:hypothetical protein
MAQGFAVLESKMNLTLICLALMKEEIRKYELEVLQRYPNDLLVHDRHMLERALQPGARLGWMVGHSHTHLVPLGLSTKENENVTYLTNLASEDRFYLIRVGHKGDVKLSEVDREAFKALSHTPVPYEMESNGDFGQFWLLKNKARIGHIHIDRTGDWQSRLYSATLTPVESTTAAIDRVALELWANQSMVKMAGTLFVKTQINWADVIRTPLAA